ncbi:MAG: hypothetical protein JWR00_3777 [Rubritepida sp.]|nr:hypothetical protein [Rubritepida sp.]
MHLFCAIISHFLASRYWGEVFGQHCFKFCFVMCLIRSICFRITTKRLGATIQCGIGQICFSEFLSADEHFSVALICYVLI